MRETQGVEKRAEHLYAWNIEVSSAFFETLGFLEIALRNALDQELSSQFSEEAVDWLHDPQSRLADKAHQLITEARFRVSRSTRSSPSHDSIVAELSFGFWTAFTAKRFESSLWTPYLRHAFPHLRPLRRAFVSARLERARSLRNRIAHHESIFTRDLKSEFDGILDVISWMSTDAARWALDHSRVPTLLANNHLSPKSIKDAAHEDETKDN